MPSQLGQSIGPRLGRIKSLRALLASVFFGVAGLLLLGLLLPSMGMAHAETLEEALISAYKGHPRLLAERARLREIDESYIQARAQGRLSSDVTGSFGYAGSVSHVKNPDPSISGRATNYLDGFPGSLGVQVIQPLYQGGRVRGLKKQAKANIMSAREMMRAAEQNILMAAASAYVDVLRDEEAARIRRSNLRLLMRQLDAANIRFDVGTATRTDIAQAQTRLASAKIGLAQAEAQLAAARAAFTNYAAHSPEQLSPVPVFILPDSLAQAMAIAHDSNPQLSAAFYNEIAADAGLDVAKSARRPTLSLAGSASGYRDQLSILDNYETVGVVAQLRIPLASGDMNRSRERAAKQARYRLRFETRDLKRSIDQSVAEVWAQLEAARTALGAAKEQAGAARTAYDGVELEQQVGTRTVLDVLNAEQELLDAKLNVVSAQADIHKISFQLLSVLGGFDAASLRLPVDYYNVDENLDYIAARSMSEKIYRDGPDMEAPEFLNAYKIKQKETLPVADIDNADIVTIDNNSTESKWR